jgi:anaerobic magnesium-protoporphyrin IX monomethyl ester cyclase
LNSASIESRILTAEEMAEKRASKLADVEFPGSISACGMPNDMPTMDGPAEEGVQVVIVDSNEPRRIQLRKDIRDQEGLVVASEATNGETGLVLLESIYVDVVVVNEGLPDMSITQFIQRVRGMETPFQSYKLLVLTGEQCDHSALDRQQVSYCPANLEAEALGEIIRQVEDEKKVQNQSLVSAQ